MEDVILQWYRGEISDQEFEKAFWSDRIPNAKDRKSIQQMSLEELKAELKFFDWSNRQFGPFDDYSRRDEIEELIAQKEK